MTILWLILKIILMLLGILIGIFICLLLGILFLPLEYKIRVEKYAAIAYYIQFKIFYLISIVYDFKTNNSIKIQLCGRTIKDISFEDTKEHVEEKIDKTQDVVIKATKEETINQNKKMVPYETAQSVSKDESKKSEEISSEEKADSKMKVKKKKIKRSNSKQKTSKKTDKINWLETIKFIWQDENRSPFIRFCKALFKDFWNAIRPKYVRFNLIFGLEDPAETGMWLAKLMALYPFYAPYGNVIGDFERDRFEGDLKLFGKTNLYRFIRPLIVFIMHKEVRSYIKLLMKIGKDE